MKVFVVNSDGVCKLQKIKKPSKVLKSTESDYTVTVKIDTNRIHKETKC